MEKRCTNTNCIRLNAAGLSGRYRNEELENRISPSNYVRNCFKEYPLEEQVEVLTSILTHNEKHVQKPPADRRICRVKTTTTVKECLQPVQETPFQTIISELRNTVTNSYWNKEVGKTRYQTPNLPEGMDPLAVTFGKKYNYDVTMADLLKQYMEEDTQSIRGHDHPLPAEQMSTKYEIQRNPNTSGIRMKRRLIWFDAGPNIVENSNLEAKNSGNASPYKDMVHGKVADKRTMSEKQNILNVCPINDDVIKQLTYLQYLNTLRRSIKRQTHKISFPDILEKLFCMDKDGTGSLHEDIVFPILVKHKIHVNKAALIPLLELLQIREGQNVRYKELLNLLNWKYDFPTLPRIEKIPLNCQYYTTTYNTMFADKGEVADTSSIPAAGISYQDPDNPTAYSLIVPNIFTRHGLCHSDLFKGRDKEELRSIVDSTGIKLSSEQLDLLWKEGLENSDCDKVSVEIFRNLLQKHDKLINEESNPISL